MTELDLDRVIHEPARLRIVALLAGVEEADFLWLLRESALTKGNLSSHLAFGTRQFQTIAKAYGGSPFGNTGANYTGSTNDAALNAGVQRFMADTTAFRKFAEDSDAARTLVAKVLERLSPANRLVITLLEIEDRSVKEIASLTGWSVPLVKVRAFRARAEMRKILQRLGREKYL